LGVSTLAASVGENEDSLLQAVEPFLLRKGFIRKTARGRVATQKAIDLVNGRTAA
jgi:Holliday junction DNA helicase RuvB